MGRGSGSGEVGGSGAWRMLTAIYGPPEFGKVGRRMWR